MLTELVYCSVATRIMTMEDLDGLLKLSREKNARLNVTGILLHSARTREFMQLLEGEKKDVEDLMRVIEMDERHTCVDVMYQDEIKTRSFEDWSMAFRPLDEMDSKLLEGYTTFNAESLPPALLNGRTSRARSMMTTLSKDL
ncbi:BLUF domain-containing protein [Rhodopirellula bahusiensis]|uniref:Protein containing BLUF domain protein n=1 Tax=Rhodopirellula bahusiensis TaxID=2014065 RepID=A0A2G1VYY4_9BACT|nr:BLUF domain-containing protein [Rhodopirellula bahusiensis]PHQ31941.1 protein containing BLUF domain protein [Rhodopirellula bahusiensis]